MSSELNENEFTPDESADPIEQELCDECGCDLDECSCEDQFIDSDDECGLCGNVDCTCEDDSNNDLEIDDE